MNKKYKLKLLISVAILGTLSMNAQAQNNSGGSVSSQGISTSIVVPEYTNAQLQAGGCDPGVWNKMVQDYKDTALTRNQIATKMQILNQVQGTPSPMASCFDQAASAINSATQSYNTISSILKGGGMDSSALYNYAKNVAVGAACSQVNQYINQSGIGTSINGGVNMVNSGINGTLGTGVNVGNSNVNLGNVLNGGGFQSNNSGNIGTISGNDIANNTGGIWNSINPFK